MEERTGIRPPGVAGMFYPSNGKELSALIGDISRDLNYRTSSEPVPGTITGGIVPHAGIEYCGRQAVHFFETLTGSKLIPDTVIIIHPNHYGAGPRLSVDDHRYWEVPNGMIKTDIDFAEEISLPFSASAQKKEHSAEVVVPFIIYYMPETVQLVSLNMLDQRHLAAKEVAGRIFEASQRLNRRVLLIASSDFSHFVSRDEATRMDDLVLDQITARNAGGVYREITENDISVCGYGPIMALMEYSSMIDPEYQVKILSRGDSGSAGKTSSVVSYISALFYM